jgi:hypothetical protein
MAALAAFSNATEAAHGLSEAVSDNDIHTGVIEL